MHVCRLVAFGYWQRGQTMVRMPPCSPGGTVCARLYCKGAAEMVLERCGSRLDERGSAQRLSQDERESILHGFSASGYRCALCAVMSGGQCFQSHSDCCLLLFMPRVACSCTGCHSIAMLSGTALLPHKPSLYG